MRYLLAMLLVALGSAVQAEDGGDRYWVEPGFRPFGHPGSGIYVDLGYATGDYYFNLGASAQDNNENVVACVDDEDCDENFNQRSAYLLVGKEFDLGGLGIVAQTGLAQSRFEYNAPSRSDEDGNAIGIPVRFTKYFGWSHIGFALSAGFTWTSIESSTYIGIGLPLGKLK